MFNNPFPHSLDNKRYLTMNYYYKNKLNTKVYKVPLESGFSCPNRDGTISDKGCFFCAGGSNAFPEISDKDLLEQYKKRKAIFENKWPGCLSMAYFQSYSNTYCSLEEMKQKLSIFVDEPDIYGLVIATRCDCLDSEKIAYLAQIAKKKELWVEIGLQSIHNETLKEMNRGHSYKDFLNCIDLLKDTGIKISVHLINGWPTESEEMMLETAKQIGRLPIHAVKFHMLHIVKNTPLASQYLKEPFELLTKPQYVEIVAKQISYLREDIIIERLTGDAILKELIAPEWTIKKVSVINDIDKKMVELDLWQSKNY